MNQKKCVIVIDKSLPIGVIANTAAILSLTLGKEHPELVGNNIINQDGEKHLGITTIPIPILAADPKELKSIRDVLKGQTTVVDFSNIAKTTKNYHDYSTQVSNTPANDLEYLGIAVYGDKQLVAKHTGNMRLVR